MSGRVLWLSSSGPRGPGDATSPFILNLAVDLCSRGWRIELLLPHAPGLADSDIIEGVPVHRFRYAWPASLERLCYGAGVLANLRRRPLDHLLVPGLVAAQWWAARRRLKAGGVALLHAHWLLPQGFTAVQAARSCAVPVISTVHGSDVFALGSGFSTALKRRALSGSRRVTVNSSVTEAAALALGAHRADLRRIPMGAAEAVADPGRVASARAHWRRGHGPLLGLIGRLVPEKGVPELLESVRLLQAAEPDVTAVIIGDGPDRAAFHHQAGQLGIADRVFFTGQVAPAQIPELLAAVDIYVGPSRTSREGGREAQGLVFAEALLAGRPVIATASGGIGDLVEHGVTGLVVPEGDPGAITAAVRRLQADPRLAGELAAAGRERARLGFTRAASADAFDALYREILQAAPG